MSSIMHEAGADASDVPLLTWIALFVGFGGFSTLFWAYFRLRPERAQAFSARPRDDAP